MSSNLIDDFEIVGFGDGRFKRIALNWALHLEDLGIENYSVICMDDEINDYLIDHNIKTKILKKEIFSDGFKADWGARFKELLRLIDSGKNIIHSDLDAVWLKNPKDYIIEGYDVIASVGNMPDYTRFYKKFHCSICMGWICVRSNEKTIKLFKSILEDPKLHRSGAFDDQIAFNFKLFDEQETLIHVVKDERSIQEAEDFICGDLSVRLLKQKVINRHNQNISECFISHPIPPYSGFKTLKLYDTPYHLESFFRGIGLWHNKII